MALFQLLMAAAIASGSSSLPSEVNDKPDDEVICVSGPSWQPSLEDSVEVEEIPVPASYSRMFEASYPCTRWAMGEESIIQWHLRFGSSHSASLALAYLERDYTKTFPDPRKFLAALRSSYDAALPDIARAASLKQPPDVSYSVSFRFMEQSKPVIRFNTLVAVRDLYTKLAEMYLAAGEEFHDKTLLGKADLYLTAAYQGALFLNPLEQVPPTKDQFNFNLHMYEYDDLRARIALLHADITQSKEDLAAVRTLILSMEKPLYADAISLAIQENMPVCQPPPDYSDTARIVEACEHDDFEESAIDYAMNRAVLNSVQSVSETRSEYWSSAFKTSMQLIDGNYIVRSAGGNRQLSYILRQSDVRWRLLSYRAISSSRKLYADRRPPTQKDSNLDSAGTDLRVALDDMTELAQTIHPYSEPGRFRRIAHQWLDLWKMRNAIEAEDSANYRGLESPDNVRFAAYLTTTLSNIDVIQRGKTIQN